MLETLIDRFGDGAVLFAGGLVVGLVFGVSAQRSRFCLRAASVEFSEMRLGPRLAVWLIAFFSAAVFVQGAVLMGWVAPPETRQIGSLGSYSGAIIGGLLFGCGMILARGCASRLLVLSATGNLRALISGLVVTLVAQASLRGGLSGPREWLAGLWMVDGGAGRDILSLAGVSASDAAMGCGAALALSLLLALRARVRAVEGMAAMGVGFAIALGWVFTFAMTRVSFEPLQPGSVTFTGPSADTLMGLINETSLPLDFNVGLVPGVFAGAALAAVMSRSWALQGFEDGPSMLRYLM